MLLIIRPGKPFFRCRSNRRVSGFQTLNAEYAKSWPNVTIKRDALPEAKEMDGVEGKLEKYFSPNPGQGKSPGKAPVEDRTPNRDALLDGQQRLDFARQYWRRAAEDAGRAQAEATEQARELASAQKRVNELRLLNEQAQKRLTAARADEAAAKKAYDSETASFERRTTPDRQQQQ